MRFTSLVVELIRARPRLVVWLVVLLQAGLWLILPALLYRSPPGDVATLLAFGREYQVGTDLGPPLASWLADIAFRAVGNHMFGVYLLAQICTVVTFLTFYHLARAIVGGQQAVLAVLLLVDGRGLQFARRRIRPAGAGAPALGVAAVAFLAIDRSEPAQRMVCLVDRSRPVAADDVGRDRAVAAAGRICRCHAPGAAHADVVRSALCAARDRRAGLALCDLAASCRCARHAALAGDIGSRRARPAIGWAAGRPGAGDVGYRGAGGPQLRLVRPQRRRSAHHLSSARRSAGARIRLFLRHRPGAARKSGRRPVQSRSRRGRRRRGAADVGACRDRCDRRSHLFAASAPVAFGLGGDACGAGAGGDCDHVLPAVDRQYGSADLDAGKRPSRVSSATVSNAEPISGCAR